MNIIITKSKDTLKKIKNDFICEKEMKLIQRNFINEKEKTLKENNCINKYEINIIHDCEQLYIYGEVPKGSIICGWDISTDVNSKPYDIICTWKRKKDLKIIGSRFFKFKLDINLSEIKKFNKDIEINWFLDIYFIYYNYLIPIQFDNNNTNIIKENKYYEKVIYLVDEYKSNNLIPNKNENFNIFPQ